MSARAYRDSTIPKCTLIVSLTNSVEINDEANHLKKKLDGIAYLYEYRENVGLHVPHLKMLISYSINLSF